MKWISVEDKLPEFEENVLLWILGDISQADRPGRWEEGRLSSIEKDGAVFKQWDSYVDGDAEVVGDVTHWLEVEPPNV